jgi:hypothetical protein
VVAIATGMWILLGIFNLEGTAVLQGSAIQAVLASGRLLRFVRASYASKLCQR